jgi:hypothetical protein
MTPFEEKVWAATFAAHYVSYLQIGSGLPHEQACGSAFECATYAVEELRRVKIEPVFGEDAGVSGAIEAHVLSLLKAGS